VESLVTQLGALTDVVASRARYSDLVVLPLPYGKNRGVEDEAVTEAARDGLERLIQAYDDPATPYLSRPDPDSAPRYSDYLHLARVKEWSGTGGEDGA
ncbi:MAG: hypothetical protein ACK4ZN_09265, partial [Oceanibaculum sp.]